MEGSVIDLTRRVAKRLEPESQRKLHGLIAHAVLTQYYSGVEQEKDSTTRNLDRQNTTYLVEQVSKTSVPNISSRIHPTEKAWSEDEFLEALEFLEGLKGKQQPHKRLSSHKFWFKGAKKLGCTSKQLQYLYIRLYPMIRLDTSKLHTDAKRGLLHSHAMKIPFARAWQAAKEESGPTPKKFELILVRKKLASEEVTKQVEVAQSKRREFQSKRRESQATVSTRE